MLTFSFIVVCNINTYLLDLSFCQLSIVGIVNQKQKYYLTKNYRYYRKIEQNLAHEFV